MNGNRLRLDTNAVLYVLGGKEAKCQVFWPFYCFLKVITTATADIAATQKPPLLYRTAFVKAKFPVVN
jgi:hypothetical protein